ncbi:GumC family protein [Thermophagus sp. OGC60D27]|uniref:GumC family protein n=1 Tax=Thermophagus sp. OGC60D27 TaxID=3458415 RepID=UPI0040379CFC
MMHNDYIKNSRAESDTFSGTRSPELTRLLERLLGKWYFFAFGLLLAWTMAFVINKFSHPLYKGNTTLLIRSEQTKPIGAQALIRDLSFDTRDNIRNQIGILKSYSLAKRTLQDLDLEISFHKTPRFLGVGRINALSRNIYQNSPIVVKTSPLSHKLMEVPFFIHILSPQKYILEVNTTINGQLLTKTDTLSFGQVVNNPYYSFSIHWKNNPKTQFETHKEEFRKYDYSFMFHDIEKLAAIYAQKLKVNFYFDDASILELSLEDKHPKLVADFLNQHTRSFIESGLEEKNRIANATIQFIDNQISGISDSLQAAESDFQKFRSQNKLINISSEGNFAMEKLETLVTEKSNLQRMLKYFEYLYEYIQTKTEFNDIIVPSTMGISDQSLNRLVTNLAEAYSARNRLLMTTRESSPQVRQINSEIESIRHALIENVRNIINTSQIEMEQINQQIEEVNKQIQKLPGTERKYINIQRDFQLNDNIYTFLLQKRAEAGIALASNIPDHKIIDPAYERNIYQTTPRPTANLVVATLLGLILPALILILGNSLNTRITAGYVVEDHTPVPVLGYIEHDSYSEKIPVIQHPASPLAESFRALRTNIEFMLGKNASSPVIAVTSSVSGEGKSFCSANLGAILAITEKKVLVVGMDLRKPQTHKEFMVENNSGLSNFLLGSSSFQQVVQNTSIDGLSIVTSGPVPPNPAELLQSDRMTEFLQSARERFDVIILDTPPLALVSDTLLITGTADLTLFVVRQRYSRKQAIEFLNHLAEAGRIKKSGILVNDVITPKGYSSISQYGYGYGYGRYKKSGYYS